MSEQGKNWKNFEGENIPSSLELFPIIFDYINVNSEILDLGCGFGKISFELYEKGYKNVYGIDINKSGIEFAKRKFSELGMKNLEHHFKIANAQRIPFENSTFDCVITQAFWTTIMPKERPIIMKEIFRSLKNDGVLYIAAFGQTWRLPLYKKRYEEGIKKGYEKGTFDAIDKKTGEVKYLAHHYTKEELENLLKTVNFKIKHYSKDIFTTQSGNSIDGHIIIAQK